MVLTTGSRNGTRQLTYGDEHGDVAQPYQNESIYQASGTTTDLISVEMWVIVRILTSGNQSKIHYHKLIW